MGSGFREIRRREVGSSSPVAFARRVGGSEVRLGQIVENGHVDTKRLGTHQGRVHKVAVEPGSPHIFYSCGEDGFVQHVGHALNCYGYSPPSKWFLLLPGVQDSVIDFLQFDLRSRCSTKLFLCTSFTESRQPIQLNAIVIDPRNPNYFSVGGDDEYARVYDIRNYQWDSSSSADLPVNTFCPRHLIGTGNVHITGLVYSNTSELLVSYNDELVYLFQKDMGIGPNPSVSSNENLPEGPEPCQPQVYLGHRNSQTVKGVSFFGPNDEYVASGSDCGHVFIWKKRGGELLRLLVGDRDTVNCIEPHPNVPFLATSGLAKNVKLWMPTAKKPAGLPNNVEEIMESNKRGREDGARIILSPDGIMHVVRLQRRRALTYMERRQSVVEAESDDDDIDGEAFILGFSDGDGGPEVVGYTGNPRDCTIC